MRRLLSLFLAIVIVLTGCSNNNIVNSNETINETMQKAIEETRAASDKNLFKEPEFSSLADKKLLQYVEDEIYAGLDSSLDEKYEIKDISTIYVSKEYLDELEFNSQKNIYFGYTLQEIADQFEGKKYVFTVNDEGKTVVKEFEKYDDTYEKALKNVAIGSGIILVCVTVSVVTGGVGAPAVSAVFAASAKTGTAFALSSGVLSGTISGVVKGIETKDVNQALKAAASSGSESFKWGAIIGSVAGGAEKALSIAKSAKTIPSAREAELNALKQYGGEEQVSYLNGKVVENTTQGATRPDIIRKVGDHIEAIEVKRYDLENSQRVRELYEVLEKQVSSRVANLPSGSTQRIVLNTQGRSYSSELIETVVENIQNRLFSIYQDIPVDVMSYVY